MENISIAEFKAQFFIKTFHQNLEFVLEEAEDRRNQKFFHTLSSYTEKLCDMIDLALKNENIGHFVEVQEYGDINITIASKNINDLQKSLLVCDTIVKKWNNKYHINEMKTNTNKSKIKIK